MLAALLGTLSACGDSGNGVSPVAAPVEGGSGAVSGLGRYTVGGTVSGLVGDGLMLEIVNPANTGHHALPLQSLPIGHDGPYRAARSADGYQVIVTQQPRAPAQRCVVRNDLGSYLLAPMPDDVINVDVVCGENAFVTQPADNSIVRIAVDASTGALGLSGTPTLAGHGPAAVAMTPDKKFLYVVNAASNDLSAFAVSAGSGALTTVPGGPVSTELSPQALAVSAGAIRGYGPPVISYYLYVANAGADRVSAYRIDRTSGRPARISTGAVATGSGPMLLAVAPDTPVLFTADLGDATLSAFLIDPSSGALSRAEGSPFASPTGVNSLAFGKSSSTAGGGPGNPFLYVAHDDGKAAGIAGFAIAANGALTALPASLIAFPHCRYLLTDRTGTYLYAAVATGIAGYHIDGATGALRLLAGLPVETAGDVQRLSIDPTNRFVYATDSTAGTVRGYARDETTGDLVPMPGSPLVVEGLATSLSIF